MLPLPFARIVLCHGLALEVPPDLDADAIESWRLKLEQELNRLYDAAWGELGKPAHDRDLSGTGISQPSGMNSL